MMENKEVYVVNLLLFLLYSKFQQLNSKNNITLKAPPVLVCMENTALGGVSQDKYSTQLRLVLYLSLDTPPRAVFSVQTRGGALSNINEVKTCLQLILKFQN